jgi:hypothetical protein
MPRHSAAARCLGRVGSDDAALGALEGLVRRDRNVASVSSSDLSGRRAGSRRRATPGASGR